MSTTFLQQILCENLLLIIIDGQKMIPNMNSNQN